jgi:hypothetical protein
MAETKDIKYLNKDFTTFKQALINYAQTYFPDTYNDFSPASPGTMFIEMASYVGDVLSYYLDNQVQETFLQYAKQKENLFALAYMLGYRPKVTSAATTDIDIYQVLPALSTGSIPDFDYTLYIDSGTQIRSTSNSDINFYIKDDIDFSFSSSLDPTEIVPLNIQQNGDIVNYLLKKTRKALAGTVQTTTFTFGGPERFPIVNINDTNIIQILDVIDSDGNIWYEVPFLGQETIFEQIENDSLNSPNLSNNSNQTPYLLRLRKTPRRFTTRFKSNNQLEIQFGAGTSLDSDEEIIPNFDNVGLGLTQGLSKLYTAFDPSNFLYTETYGIAPKNTTLTVRYLTGGGIESNIPAGDLTTISSQTIQFKNQGIVNNNILNSVSVNNPLAASGGKDGDTNEEIQLNTLAAFPAQMRAVTKEDYIIRALSMPPKFGTVAKIYIQQDQALSNNSTTDNIIDSNPLSLSFYILSYDINKKLALADQALKQNLKTYLDEYRLLTDAINLKDAFIINIGVDFEVIVRPNYNSSDVLIRCVESLQDYFNIAKWQINQPIILQELFILIDKIPGVQTVEDIKIINKTGVSLGYSQYAYDIPGATKKNIIYPSLDPSIFEVKFPNSDIRGKISSL